MKQRREFLKYMFGFFSAAAFQFSPFFSLIKNAYAKAKRKILPRGTRVETLTVEDPKDLDTRNLEITPISEFQTMGETENAVDIDKWRLHVTGRVKKPLKLTYSEILEMPSINKRVLLICPGFFAFNADWKGISMKNLLEKAGFDEKSTHVSFYGGPEELNAKVDKFPIAEVLANKVFLAYEVNWVPLPEKHGYPLRVVAEDEYGGTWVKYVYEMHLE